LAAALVAICACSGATGARPAVSPTAAATPSAWQSQALDGDVYAAPVLAGDRVIVVTQHNTVYAFDSATGRPLWHTALGPSVDASALPCGNVRPESGALSTPVADAEHRLLYVVAFVAPAHHQLFVVELDSGRIREQQAVDPPGESPLTEQQRGALALANGYVYIPYGGLFGDCGNYHGWLLAVPVAHGNVLSYRVPCTRGCGLWAPGGPTVDGAGNLWVAGGNSFSETVFDHGNTVVELSPTLKELGYFAPSDWLALNHADADLGSISPVILEGGRVWISGKDGNGYLLSAARPGGVGGQLYKAALGCATFGGAAYAAPDLYLACPDAVLALRVDPSAARFSVRWRSSASGPGAPVLAQGSIWVIETGSGTLTALDPAGGGVRFSARIGEAMHFARAAVGSGRVFAVGGRKLQAFVARPQVPAG
jgi:polyvinyl alcohol dehydrogenase (cytochrome)